MIHNVIFDQKNCQEISCIYDDLALYKYEMFLIETIDSLRKNFIYPWCSNNFAHIRKTFA